MQLSIEIILNALSQDQRRVLDLITAYVRGVDVVVQFMQRDLGGHPLRMWQEGKIPTKGQLNTSLRGRFHFRHHGCVVVFLSMRFEFDFGPAGRCDGFTAYLLDRHVQHNKFWRRQLRDVSMRSRLNELVALELVHAPQWEPTPHLLYLTSPGRDVLEHLRRTR